MWARLSLLVAGMAACASLATAQPAPDRHRISREAPAGAKARTFAPNLPSRPQAQPRTLARIASEHPVSSSRFSLSPAEKRFPRADFTLARPFKQITAQHSAFLSEARIPIVQTWGSRLRLAGVQQRFHAANLYSVLSPASLAEVATAPGADGLVARPRVNYGLGLQFRF